MTDCCILNSAFDASNLGYRVTVAWDLVRGTNPEMEDAALNMVSLHIGLIAESGDLLAERRRQVAAGNAAVSAMKLARAFRRRHRALDNRGQLIRV